MAAALAIATPASAIPNDFSASFDAGDIGTAVPITFNGISDGSVLDGLSAELTLTLTDIDLLTNTYTFDFNIFNSTDSSIWDSATITALGFNVDPDYDSATLTGTSWHLVSGGGSFPDNGLDDSSVELCFESDANNNCGGNNPANGVEIGTNEDGVFTLTFSDPTTEVTLSNFIVRYQELASDQYPDISSATGIPGGGPIPEPATWAMMILGLGMIGSSIRRRRQTFGGSVVLA